MTTDRSESQDFEALHARCKAAGVDLMRAQDFEGEPSFVASRWGQFIRLPTLLAVENWLAWTTGEAARQARFKRGQWGA